MKKCWDANPEKRPEMHEVVRMLEAIDTSKGGGMINPDDIKCFCLGPFGKLRGLWFIYTLSSLDDVEIKKSQSSMLVFVYFAVIWCRHSFVTAEICSHMLTTLQLPDVFV